MARIRSIKPEFWHDEKIAPLSPLTRLVFLGLISQADDAGRLVDSVKMIDGLIFPFSDDSCGPSLDELERLDRIERYQVESGQRLIQISGWTEHQKVKNPSSFTLPGPEEAAPQGLTESSVDSPEGGSRAAVDSTPRARAGAAPTQGIGDPTTGNGGGDSDPLADWLGTHANVLDDCPPVQEAITRRTLYQHFGPPGMRANAWARPDGSPAPDIDRARIFAVALSGYAAEGKRQIATNEFAGMLRATIAQFYAAPKKPPPGSEAAEWSDPEVESWRDTRRRMQAREASEIRRLTIEAAPPDARSA